MDRAGCWVLGRIVGSGVCLRDRDAQHRGIRSRKAPPASPWLCFPQLQKADICLLTSAGSEVGVVGVRRPGAQHSGGLGVGRGRVPLGSNRR